MALFPCPECGGPVSDAAAACPHCGYPMGRAGPAPGRVGASPLDTLGPELAREVRAALRQAGLGEAVRTGHVRVGPVTTTVGEPVVTTWASTSAGGGTVPPVGGAVDREMTAAEVLAATPLGWAGSRSAYRFGSGYDYRSGWTLLGWPLLAMSQGYDPATGRKRVAKGWVAIGDVAVGGLAIGGAAFGGVCLGGVSVGLVSLGGLAVGGLLAIGGAAIGTVALGGLAVGAWALGGGAFGLHVLGPMGMR